jgi:hypothetical protein
LAVVEFSLVMSLWVLRAHFVAGIGLFGLLILALAGALFIAAFLCMLYLALEPYVRRHWPHAIISWTRLLSGKIRDPLVGRDIMIGMVLGLFWVIAFQVSFVLEHRLGGPPTFGSSDYFQGTRSVLGAWMNNLTGSIQGTLAFFFLLFLLRVLLRKPWLAMIAFVAFWTGLKLIGSHYPAIEGTTYVVVYGLAALMVMRFGFLSLALAIFVADLLTNVPLTSHFSEWYFAGPFFVWLSVLAIGCWAFYIALAGQKLWQKSLLD